MWKTGATIPQNNNDDDDWETDPDYVNNMSEEQQRWGGERDGGGSIKWVFFSKNIWFENHEEPGLAIPAKK